jgi:hypothetical protein
VTAGVVVVVTFIAGVVVVGVVVVGVVVVEVVVVVVVVLFEKLTGFGFVVTKRSFTPMRLHWTSHIPDIPGGIGNGLLSPD